MIEWLYSLRQPASLYHVVEEIHENVAFGSDKGLLPVCGAWCMRYLSAEFG